MTARVLFATCVVALLVPVSAAAKPTKSQHSQRIAKLQQQISESQSVVRFWNNKGRWALALDREWCWSFTGVKREQVCLKARRNLRAHKERITWAKSRLVALAEAEQARIERALARMGPVDAIKYVFGGYADQALAVARCESGLYIWASNGQYQGLFQMGSGERARYGHANHAYGQAKAAYAYFKASGRTWGPWECKPW